MLKLYFLFLIKKNFNNLELWKNYFKNANNYQIIIHPKIYKEIFLGLNEEVLYPIETKWGDISLADAVVYLLKKAVATNKSSKCYFILLSDDSVPIHSYNRFYKFLNLNKLSFFSHSDYLIGTKRYNREFIFSSQFFCVNKEDAQIVVNNYIKYRNKIKNRSALEKDRHRMYSPDETFMLSILFYENKNYKFNDRNIIERISFWYRETIPEIENLIKSYKTLAYKLYKLQDSNKINQVQKDALDALILLKKYGINHPITFLYHKKLISKFKKKSPESFFLRKIVSGDNKIGFKYEDISKLKSFFDNNDYQNITKFINLNIFNLKTFR